jgi:hypothetical protein
MAIVDVKNLSVGQKGFFEYYPEFGRASGSVSSIHSFHFFSSKRDWAIARRSIEANQDETSKSCAHQAGERPRLATHTG